MGCLSYYILECPITGRFPNTTRGGPFSDALAVPSLGE
jgi:hypothetical protein